MKKILKRISFLLVLSALPLLSGLCGKGLCLQYAEGRLVINGTLQQEMKLHVDGSFLPGGAGYDIPNFRSSFKLESTWKVFETDDYMMDLRVVAKNFYDAATDIDDDYRDSMNLYSTRDAKHTLRYYNIFRDICREAFLNFDTDTLQVRIGKQIVNWGETSAVRMADVVNPMDQLGLVNQAFLTNFYEVKRGLWMINMQYAPQNMPLDPQFEFLLIPDFQPDLLPPFGAYPPIGISEPFRTFKKFDDVLIESRQQAREKSWSQPQMGFRGRVMLWGAECRLQYLHQRIKTPVVAGTDGTQALYGALLFGRSARDIWDYPFYSTFGFTMNRPFSFNIPLGFSRLDGNRLFIESVLDYNRPFNRQSGDIKRMKRYGLAVAWDFKMYLPYITPWNTNKWLYAKFQFFNNWLPSKKSTDEWGVAGSGTISTFFGMPASRHSGSTFTAQLEYEMFKSRVNPAIAFSHNVNANSGLWLFMLNILPVGEWMINVSYVDIFHSLAKHTDYMVFGVKRDF
ncbi:MAG: DUF1302 family protein [Chitinispirillaceae bacterium]|nr:DUF1302 family protein [Chitinispirillaceae bacterium]